MQRKTLTINDVLGNAIRNASVRVYLTGTTTAAALFADRAGLVPILQPLNTDGRGQCYFYAANGRYDIEASRAGQVIQTHADILLDDPSDNTATRDVINVKDFPYNAKGDGVTDDTAAIAAAIDAAQAKPYGAAVYLPAGRYRTTSTITRSISKQLVMYGDGAASQVMGATAFGYLFAITASANAAYGSVFRDFACITAMSGRTHGFDITNGNAFVFDRLLVQGQNNAMRFTNSYAVRICCTFDVTQSEAVRFTTSAHGANLRGSKFYSCGNTNSLPAVNFQVATNNIILDDVISEYNYKLASFQSCTSIRINGSYIEYNAANDVDFLGSCVGVSMDDNWLYAGFPTFTLANVIGLSFKRNTVGNKTVQLGTGTSNIDVDKNATVTGGSVEINYWSEQAAALGGIPFLQPDGPDPDIQARISSKGAADIALYTGSQGVLAGVFLHVASAVNYVRFEPAVAGSPATVRGFGEANAGLRLIARGTGAINSASPHRFDGNVGFYGTTPVAKPTITGSVAGNAAAASIAAALAALGLVTNNTTA